MTHGDFLRGSWRVMSSEYVGKSMYTIVRDRLRSDSELPELGFRGLHPASVKLAHPVCDDGLSHPSHYHCTCSLELATSARLTTTRLVCKTRTNSFSCD